jgi:hypothetical protein
MRALRRQTDALLRDGGEIRRQGGLPRDGAQSFPSDFYQQW